MISRLSWLAALLACALFASGELSNRRAPGFALPDPDYEQFYDLQDYRGKVVLIEIMSTKCPHCLLLSTTLEDMKQKYGDDLAILSVVLPPDNRDTIAEYRQVNKITVPIICDQGQMTISYMNARPGVGHIDVPHLFIIDQEGIIRNDFSYKEDARSVFEGPGLIREIERLLAASPEQQKAEAPPTPLAPPPPPEAPPPPKSVSRGDTKDQVEAVLGRPEKVVKLDGKEIYYYKDLKVTFVNAKVADVQ